MNIVLHNAQDTLLLGAELWRILPKKCLVFLDGELGAGKTTLTRGVLRAAGYQATVKSPTYTLVEEYTLPTGKLYHFDLYRLTDAQELEWLGIQDYFAEQSICFIEWAKKGKGFLPRADLEISIATKTNSRTANIVNLSASKLKLCWKNNNTLL